MTFLYRNRLLGVSFSIEVNLVKSTRLFIYQYHYQNVRLYQFWAYFFYASFCLNSSF